MRLKTRVPEWPFPRNLPPERAPRATLAWRWSVMTWRERGWALFWVYVGGAIALSIVGNLLP